MVFIRNYIPAIIIKIKNCIIISVDFNLLILHKTAYNGIMKIINPSQLGVGHVFSWSKEYLLEYLISGKNPALQDPKLIAAFRKIDRKDFVPYEKKDSAYIDQELEIGYGEKITRPSVLAQMAELMQLKTGGKYLDIGSGTGYFGMILACAIGDEGKVISLERLQWLWEMARTNSTKYSDIRNISFLYRDGLSGFKEHAPFDGIHVAFALETVPDTLKSQLKSNGGILIMPSTNYDIRVLERNGDEFTEEIIPGFVFDIGKEGVG